jgi:type IV pilus assembly protein PilO
MVSLSKNKSLNVELNSVFEGATAQFRALNWNEPGQWPLLPKAMAWFFTFAVMVTALWFLVLTGAHDELDAERAKEPVLKADFKSKLTQAVNLEELRKQKVQVEEYVTQLEKQLPGKAEMDALLSDINQAGLGRGLQFESFKPGDFVLRDYYGEKLITIKVVGRYHDIGAFAADIANLSRIVTLHNLTITTPTSNSGVPNTGGLLAMEATARAYRYLDEAEIEKTRQAAAKAKAKAKPGAPAK